MNFRQSTFVYTIATTIIGFILAALCAFALSSETGGGYLHIFGLFFSGGLVIGSWVNALHVLGMSDFAETDEFGMTYPKVGETA